jgi:hypothetical protein
MQTAYRLVPSRSAGLGSASAGVPIGRGIRIRASLEELMNIIERVKRICLTPKTEWHVIESEPATPSALMAGYVAPLAVIGAIAGFIGGSLVGTSLPFVGTFRVPILSGIVSAVFMFVMSIVAVFLISLVINLLAPSFGGRQNSLQALKVAVYSYTPAWVAGVFHIVPLLGIFAFLISLYSLYLLYLGLPRLMKCPEDKSVLYTIVVVVCAIALSFFIAAAGAVFGGMGMLASGGLAGLGGRQAEPEVKFDKDSPLGKLEAVGKKMEEASKKMEAAQKSGDQEAQTKAVMEGIGAIFGGGKRVDPLQIEQIKPFVPGSFAGLPRQSGETERNGIAGLVVTKATTRYGEGDKHITLDITDTGGASGLMAFASWATLAGDRETDSERETMRKVNGRFVHEKVSKTGGTNEFELVLGERFIVSARGSGVSIDELRSAVSSLELAKLESLKNTGVEK